MAATKSYKFGSVAEIRNLAKLREAKDDKELLKFRERISNKVNELVSREHNGKEKT